jgi:hypothetical protein
MNKAHLEGLGEQLCDFLLSEGARTLEDFGVAFHFPLLLAAASTRTYGATENLSSPPTVDGTVGMGKTHN